MEKIHVLAKMLGTSAEWLRWGQETVHQAMPTNVTLTDKQLAESVLHDWSLLTHANKQLISAILDLLLKQQSLQKSLA
jgi:hypothetical protein